MILSQIVEVHLSVDLITVQLVLLAWTAALVDVQGTMTARRKKLVIMPTVSVARGPTIQIPPSATKASSAPWERVDATLTLNVKVLIWRNNI